MTKGEGGAGESEDGGDCRRLWEGEIEVQAIEPNAILRGEVRIPNYFKDFWQPILGHKAAATYEMILRFAYGESETCTVSLYRLAASLGMTRNELKGRERRAGGHSGLDRSYRQRGTLNVLCRAGLLQVQIRGHPGKQSYVFKILRTPPLLSSAQVRMLPAILQRAHLDLMERCRRDLEKRRRMHPPSTGGELEPRGGRWPRQGASRRSGHQVAMASTIQASPGAHGTQDQVPLASRGGATGTQDRVPLAPRTRHTDSLQPRQRQRTGPNGDGRTGEGIPKEVVVVVRNSIFRDVPERCLASLVAQYGAERVARFADVLDWQYRRGTRAVRRPFALLARTLRTNGLDVPEDYVPFGERARRLGDAEARAMEQRQTVRAREREATARRQMAEKAFAAMSEAEREAWRQQAVENVPAILRDHRRVVENVMFHMIGEGRRGSGAASIG